MAGALIEPLVDAFGLVGGIKLARDAGVAGLELLQARKTFALHVRTNMDRGQLTRQALSQPAFARTGQSVHQDEQRRFALQARGRDTNKNVLPVHGRISFATVCARGGQCTNLGTHQCVVGFVEVEAFAGLVVSGSH